MAFKDNLKELMKDKNIGNNKLSIYSGVASSTITYITQGKRNPKPSTLRKLAHGLHVPASKLFTMAGIEPKADNSGPDKIHIERDVDLDQLAKDVEAGKVKRFHGHVIPQSTLKYFIKILQMEAKLEDAKKSNK